MISYQAIKPSFIIINEFNNLFEPRPEVQYFNRLWSSKSGRHLSPAFFVPFKDFVFLTPDLRACGHPPAQFDKWGSTYEQPLKTNSI